MSIFDTDSQILKEHEKNTKQFILDFEKTSPEKRFIFGNNIYTKSLMNFYEVGGIIDEFTPSQEINGVKVHRLSQLPADAVVVVASGGMTQTILSKLKFAGIYSIDYFAFKKHSVLNLVDIVFNENFLEDYDSNIGHYDRVYSSLADETSREIFLNLVKFRNTLDIRFLSKFVDRQQEQYFESFLHIYDKNVVFMDVGSFDGATALNFIKFCPNYKSIEIFEPIASQMAVVKEKMIGCSRINFNEFALSNTIGKRTINVQGSGSNISDNGNYEIQTSVLDKFHPEIGDDIFLKIDVEGHEMSLLEGGMNFIKNYKPIIAISIYHSVGDFWRIPDFIMELNPGYRIYIRHYTETIYETVAFFIP